jgi:hypothetical protein
MIKQIDDDDDESLISSCKHFISSLEKYLGFYALLKQ